jgi:hypothetical protein
LLYYHNQRAHGQRPQRGGQAQAEHVQQRRPVGEAAGPSVGHEPRGRAARVPVTLRREKGHDIAAACGQLRLKTEKDRELAQA